MFISTYISGTMSHYLHQFQDNYTTEQYANLMAALASKYYTPTQTLQIAEWHIYGSSRVGIYRVNKALAMLNEGTISNYSYKTRVKLRYNVKKSYELSIVP